MGLMDFPKPLEEMLDEANLQDLPRILNVVEEWLVANRYQWEINGNLTQAITDLIENELRSPTIPQ